jgi:hypothetical protein
MSSGLSALGWSTGAVHPNDDIEPHAFILGIASVGRPEAAS